MTRNRQREHKTVSLPVARVYCSSSPFQADTASPHLACLDSPQSGSYRVVFAISHHFCCLLLFPHIFSPWLFFTFCVFTMPPSSNLKQPMGKARYVSVHILATYIPIALFVPIQSSRGEGSPHVLSSGSFSHQRYSPSRCVPGSRAPNSARFDCASYISSAINSPPTRTDIPKISVSTLDGTAVAPEAAPLITSLDKQWLESMYAQSCRSHNVNPTVYSHLTL